MLEIAKNKLGNDATLILGDSERLPFEDSSFDAIVCNDSFHHYPQPDIVEKEVSRCLKQNGVFIIFTTRKPPEIPPSDILFFNLIIHRRIA